MDDTRNSPPNGRSHKNRNNTEYKKINKLIKHKIELAKEPWKKDRCKEVEEFQIDNFNLHKKLKELQEFFEY